jgi:hypothetical protein
MAHGWDGFTRIFYFVAVENRLQRQDNNGFKKGTDLGSFYPFLSPSVVVWATKTLTDTYHLKLPKPLF